MGLEVEFTSSVQQLSGRKWPLVTCIGVLDYYPDPQPLLIELKQFLELDGKLVVTFPNAWSPMGWVYFLLSRFTTPARPSFAGFVQRRAGDCGLVVSAVSYAFPPVHLIGYTVVMELRPRG